MPIKQIFQTIMFEIISNMSTTDMVVL